MRILENSMIHKGKIIENKRKLSEKHRFWKSSISMSNDNNKNNNNINESNPRNNNNLNNSDNRNNRSQGNRKIEKIGL